jgi:hypothetical protein
MLADFFTKPLQGALFRKVRDVLLGHAHIRTLITPTSIPVEERVGIVQPEPGSADNCAHATTVLHGTEASEENDGFIKVLRRKKRDSPGKNTQGHDTVKGNKMNGASEVKKDIKSRNASFEFINSKLSRLN